MTIPTDTLIDDAPSGRVVCNIGQVSRKGAYQLNKLVKAGHLTKWRGYWYPVAGAPFGIGPLKTCWGLPEIHAQLEGLRQ